jgi:hypothetical protein
MIAPRASIHSGFWPFQRVAELVTADNIDRSFVLMDMGHAVCDVARTDPQLTSDAVKIGNLLVVESDVTQPWAGFIVSLDEALGSGSIEVSAVDFAAALEVRLANQGLVYESSIGSGSIFLDLIRSANARAHTGVLTPGVVANGPAISGIALGAQSVLAGLNELHDRTDYEWWLDVSVRAARVECVARWDSQQGLDLSGHVALIENVHFGSLSYRLDSSQISEAAVAIGGGGVVADRSSITFSAATSPGRNRIGGSIEMGSQLAVRSVADLPAGLRTERVVFDPGTTLETELSRQARRALERPLGAGERFTLTANDSADWSKLGVGNYIRIVASFGLGDINRRVRIVGMQPDEEMGVCELVVEGAST